MKRGVGQNPSWDVYKPGGQLQETSDLSVIANKGFATKY